MSLPYASSGSEALAVRVRGTGSVTEQPLPCRFPRAVAPATGRGEADPRGAGQGGRSFPAGGQRPGTGYRPGPARKDTAMLLAGALGLAGPVVVVFVEAARGRTSALDVLAALGRSGAVAWCGSRLWFRPAISRLPAATTCWRRCGTTAGRACRGGAGAARDGWDRRKSQLAAQRVHRFAGSYDLAWWINAEQGGLIGDQIADLGLALGCVPAGGGSQAVRAAVLAEFRHRGRWAADLRQRRGARRCGPWLPGVGGHVLITSRERGWDEIAAPVEVECLPGPNRSR